MVLAAEMVTANHYSGEKIAIAARQIAVLAALMEHAIMENHVKRVQVIAEIVKLPVEMEHVKEKKIVIPVLKIAEIVAEMEVVILVKTA